MENAQQPKLFRKNENKVALSEVEEKLKVMRQKRLSRLSTFIDEQNKLLEERSTKSDVMAEAIMSIQQSAPEKVKFSIKPIAEDRSEDSAQEEGGIVGEKKKTVRTKKLFERFSCVGQGLDDDDEEEEDEERFRRDVKAHGIVSGTLTLHRKSKEFKKEDRSTSAAGVADQGSAGVGEKSEDVADRTNRKFTYGIWTPHKLPKEIGKDETKHEENRNNGLPQFSNEDAVDREKNDVLNKIAYGNMLPKKTPNETHDKGTSSTVYENVKRHHSPAGKSNSFTSSDRVTKKISTLDSTTSQSSESVSSSYVTLTFPRKAKPTKIQDAQNLEPSEIVNESRKKTHQVKEEGKHPSSKLENIVANRDEENVYEMVAVKDNKMVLSADKVPEKLDSHTKAYQSTSNSIQKDTSVSSIEETESLRTNETDEIKLALKKQSETDVSGSGILNPKSPVPTPRKVGAEYNTVLDFQTNMLHLTRRGDMDEEDIEEFNACYNKMTKLLADYRRRMMDVERKKLPGKRLNQIKEALSVVDQRIKKYRGLKRDPEYGEIKNLLSGFFSEISKMSVEVFEKKEQKDELLKVVDRCAKKLAKKAMKNEEAMTEVFRDQIDLITAKRVVGTYI
nr:unnamed protein product [Callosobruchus chinensis]